MQASLRSGWFAGAVLLCLYHPCKLPCALGGSLARFCLVCTTHSSFLTLWVVRWRGFALFVPPMQASLRSRWFAGAVFPCLYHPLKLPCALGGSIVCEIARKSSKRIVKMSYRQKSKSLKNRALHTKRPKKVILFESSNDNYQL